MKTFSTFIILHEKRNISIREVLNYELGALPLSIPCADEGMIKSNKASLARELKIVPIEIWCMELHVDYTSIIEDKVLWQNVAKHCSTFGEISYYF